MLVNSSLLDKGAPTSALERAVLLLYAVEMNSCAQLVNWKSELKRRSFIMPRRFKGALSFKKEYPVPTGQSAAAVKVSSRS